MSGISVDVGSMQQELTDQLTAPGKTIDVRNIPRSMRHPLIFGTFDRLAPGESFCVVSDHDPRPLRYLFDVKYLGAFSWEYVETGPSIWRVCVGRAAEAA